MDGNAMRQETIYQYTVLFEPADEGGIRFMFPVYPVVLQKGIPWMKLAKWQWMRYAGILI